MRDWYNYWRAPLSFLTTSSASLKSPTGYPITPPHPTQHTHTQFISGLCSRLDGCHGHVTQLLRRASSKPHPILIPGRRFTLLSMYLSCFGSSEHMIRMGIEWKPLKCRSLKCNLPHKCHATHIFPFFVWLNNLCLYVAIALISSFFTGRTCVYIINTLVFLLFGYVSKQKSSICLPEQWLLASVIF